MTTPSWMVPPLPELPAGPNPKRPWIVSQEPTGDGFVRVTYATPDLQRICVSVPETAWLNGEHVQLAEDLWSHRAALGGSQ